MSRFYKLRCQVTAHRGDVRAVSCSSDTEFFSASRDFTAKSWYVSREGCDVHENVTFLGHENYVSSVAVFFKEDKCDENFVVTGSQDSRIRIFSTSSSKPLFILEGHTDAVCSVAVDKTKRIVSGSWDKSIKLWIDHKCVATLTGHSASVWCVMFLSTSGVATSNDSLTIVSGSADKTLRIWTVQELSTESHTPEVKSINTLTGHTDCVRALAIIDDERFLSASNDASIRAWHAPTGTCIGEFYGHCNYIYDLATASGSPVFASCGEDRNLCVWSMPSIEEFGYGKQFSCLQIISHPCTSVWCVTLTPNWDIITGGSDSKIRLFSSAPERQASNDVLQNYEKELANFKIVSPLGSGTGDFDMSKLPGVEALTRHGKSEGQVMMINNNGRPKCYQWSAHESRWIEVGDVIGTQSSSQTTYEGKEYDFVFSVDISDGMPSLKLPYNRSEDPWMAAHNFIQKHDLPADYLDRVANFIVQNAGPQLSPPNLETDPRNCDPYTGANRYIPQSSNNLNQSDVYFPSKTFISLKSLSLDPLIDKLKVFNSQSSDTIDSDLMDHIKQFSFSCNDEQAFSLASRLLIIIKKWPIDTIFPFLDLLRCLVFWTQCSELIFKTDNWTFLLNASLDNPKLPVANCLLVLRLLGNSLAADGPRLLTANNTTNPTSIITCINIVSKLRQLMDDDSLKLMDRKQHQVAIATFLHNLSVLVYLSNDHAKSLPQLKFVPGVCVRLSLSLLSVGPLLGPAAVARSHPDAVFALFLCVANCLLATHSESSAQQVQLLASAAAGLKPDANESAQEDVLVGLEYAYQIINYWVKTQTVASKIRGVATKLMEHLEGK